MQAYQIIREITGIGEGKGAFIAMSDGISGLAPWAGLLPNVDRVAIDAHPYFAFNGQANTDPVNVAAPDGNMGGVWPAMACTSWKSAQTDRYVVILSPSRRLTNFFQAKPPSVSLLEENTVTASMIAAST